MNNQNPMLYNPVMNVSQPMQQPMQPMQPNAVGAQPGFFGPMFQPQQMQQQSRPVQNNFDFVRVNGYDEIKNAYVEKGQGTWFMLLNEPVIAYKSANNVGLTNTSYFKVVEFHPEVEMKEQSNNVPDFSQQFQQLSMRMNKIEEQLKNFNWDGEINGKSSATMHESNEPGATDANANRRRTTSSR